jgi:predicted dehydrogenase
MKADRRQFIKVAAAASVSTASARRVVGANERIKVGVIGTGGRGQLLMDYFQRAPDAEIAAICDVYEPRLNQARDKLTNPSPVRLHGDYRRILEEKAIDAVVIAPPDHWHTPMAIEALAAGKDLFLEKPVTHTLDEGAKLLAAVKGSKQVVQTGTQNRSMPHFVQAKALVASGELGRVALVETYFYQNYLRTDPARIPLDPAKLDWKGFLGSAPEQPLDRGRFQQWRWYWDFGGGALTDLFTHVVDVAHWYLGKDTPLSASAVGSNALIPRWETPDTLSACFAYPDGLVVTFNAMMGGSLQGGGTLFRGTKAMLRISRRGFEVWDEPAQFVSQALGPPRLEVKAEGDTMMPHVRNFLDCMRSRGTPNAPIEAGIACARAGHLGNLALRQGRKVADAT